VLFALGDEYLPRHAPVACIQVLCRAPEPQRQERLAARAADPARHPGHRDGAWVAQSGVAGDGFLDLAGSQKVHAGDTSDPAHGCALIRSLTNRQLV
jgi:hypothetical protein